MFYSRYGFSSFRVIERDATEDENGTKLNQYRAHLQTIPNRNRQTRKITVRFYSNRPVVALRRIVEAANRGVDPVSFNDTAVVV